MTNQDEINWLSLSPEEKNRQLFEKQKNLLHTFLSHGAIDATQYRKSLTCLAEKMGIELKEYDLPFQMTES